MHSTSLACLCLVVVLINVGPDSKKVSLSLTAKPIVGCQANPECPNDKACFNTKCVNPCNCGINALCDVIDHVPLCYCPPGYSGDPKVECQKRKSGLPVTLSKL